MIDLAPFIVAAKAVVLALGGVITHLAYRAFRRTGAPALRSFAVGFGIITLGLALGGGLDLLVGVDLRVAVFAQSVLAAVGFLVLAYSLYVEPPTVDDAVDRTPPRSERPTDD